jgi:hypothetical protein
MNNEQFNYLNIWIINCSNNTPSDKQDSAQQAVRQVISMVITPLWYNWPGASIYHRSYVIIGDWLHESKQESLQRRANHYI